MIPAVYSNGRWPAFGNQVQGMQSHRQFQICDLQIQMSKNRKKMSASYVKYLEHLLWCHCLSYQSLNHPGRSKMRNHSQPPVRSPRSRQSGSRSPRPPPSCWVRQRSRCSFQSRLQTEREPAGPETTSVCHRSSEGRRGPSGSAEMYGCLDWGSILQSIPQPIKTRGNKRRGSLWTKKNGNDTAINMIKRPI